MMFLKIEYLNKELNQSVKVKKLHKLSVMPATIQNNSINEVNNNLKKYRGTNSSSSTSNIRNSSEGINSSSISSLGISLPSTSQTIGASSFENLTYQSNSVPNSQSTKSFPELLEAYRSQAKNSIDPYVQYGFVEFLLDSSNKIRQDPSQLGINLRLDSSISSSSSSFSSSSSKSKSAIGSPNQEGGLEKKANILKLLEGEAVRWLKRLATSSTGIGRQPLADAQFILAGFYGRGLFGLTVDHIKAFGLYVQASKQNHPAATFRAAVCYEVGAGTKRDNGRAVQFYKKAAALGDPLAMHKVSIILLYGKMGQRKNLKEGITWLKRAAGTANSQHPESIHDLAQCYEKKGGCPVLIPDEQYAFELYSRAADFGYAASQYRLGSCYEYGLLGCAVDAANSIKWYSRSADQGYSDAELALSSWYLSGSHGVLQQSDLDAYMWAKKSAERGNAKAQYQVGNCFEIGIGVDADPQEAIIWYSKADEQGHKRASQRLIELKKKGKNGSSDGKDGGKCIIF